MTTTLTHDPLASPPSPRGADAFEPVRMSWLEMARVNFPGNPTGKPPHFADPHLNQTVSRGHCLALQIVEMNDRDADLLIDGPREAVTLRLYLAAADGEFEPRTHYRDALQMIGYCDQAFITREEWR